MIAVSPAPSPELARALEAACTEALRPSRCEVQEGAAAPDVRVEIATPQSAHVEVRGSAWLGRSLTFRDEDPPLDIFRSLGLVAAALVSRAASEAETAMPPVPTLRHDEPRLPRLWLVGGAIVGSGLDRGPVSFGGALRGGYQLPIPVFVGASGSYATAGRGPQGLRATWTTFSLDAGTVFAFSDVILRPRLEVILSRLVAEGAEGPGGTSGSRQLAGAGAGFELVWPSTERISLVLGADGSFLSSGTSIRLGDTRLSAFPALGYRFFLGIEVAVLP